MISIEQAVDKLLSLTPSLDQHEQIPITSALGRILAENIISTIDVPPQNNSAMDGYVIRTSDLENPPWTFPVSSVIPAGAIPHAIPAGSIARIFTGAEIPENCDAVVMQENCEVDPNSEKVTLLKPVTPGENIRAKGQDIAKGDTILGKGQQLSPQDIGLLASIGVTHVHVAQKVRVAIITTGDELISATDSHLLPPGKIFNSNLPMLQALLEKANCEVISALHIPDNLQQTTHTLTECSHTADLIISCGGVSVGEKDFVKDALEQVGELDFWKVKLKPGKPIAIGKINQARFLGLPGNPVSSFVTFILFALPVIKKLQGRPYKAPRYFTLPCNFSLSSPRTRPEFIRVQMTENGIEQFPNQSSGVLRSLSWADALAFIPEETRLSPGEPIKTYPLSLFFE
ncbi:Molybdopterin molybdenumtransferase [Thalassocella blandensis]|nr:Molybdopterin molybdenumtransferase [Thalassocella blandensis]